MLLIYTKNSTSRLQYIFRFIFKRILGVGYSLTTHRESFDVYDGPKLIYADEINTTVLFSIKPHGLLFETGVKEQDITCFEHNGLKAFFKTADSDYPFDIFAASFFLLSRYEEYLPHDKDVYGRYAHTNSIAFKENFLHLPLVNLWIKDFAAVLKNNFPSLTYILPPFRFLPTYDIDIAFSYRHKGLVRSIGGFIKNPSLDRIKVLMGIKTDNYAAYDFLDKLHVEKNISPIYFFLVSQRDSKYDKNISPYSHGMWQLIKRHAKHYVNGLHPSWRSKKSVEIIKKEKKILDTASEKNITHSRQHYIQFSLPETFQNLIETGITDEYSMGYGSINGFRASSASPFYWYNLATEKVSNLLIHPFCFMDANCYYEAGISAKEAGEELMYYLITCKEVNGELITIFHNHILGTDKKFEGWKEMYDQFTSRVQQ